MNLRQLAASHEIATDWAEALAPVQAELDSLTEFLVAERAAGHTVMPPTEHVLRAFRQPLASVRVLLVGQDPYPTPGHAIGLAFSCDASVRPLPRSLANIYRELHDDLGITPPGHGDLGEWTERGVLLLNRVLTTRGGEAGSHRNRGWEAVTERAIDALVDRGTPLAAILWGKDARQLTPRLEPYPVIESAHPSPLSARNGFFGSRPFSRANEALIAQGAAPIDWRLTPEVEAIW